MFEAVLEYSLTALPFLKFPTESVNLLPSLPRQVIVGALHTIEFTTLLRPCTWVRRIDTRLLGSASLVVIAVGENVIVPGLMKHHLVEFLV